MDPVAAKDVECNLRDEVLISGFSDALRTESFTRDLAIQRHTTSGQRQRSNKKLQVERQCESQNIEPSPKICARAGDLYFEHICIADELAKSAVLRCSKQEGAEPRKLDASRTQP